MSGKHKLQDLIRELGSDSLNEATTRHRIIDRLLHDCLDWSPSSVTAEHYEDGEYADYVLGAPTPEVVVEAKREGVHFTLPAGLAGRRSVDLRSLRDDPLCDKAVRQVLRYCQDRGVPIAVLTNGRQLVAFYASRQDGVPPLNGRALLFSSLDEMLADFDSLWNNLSREGIGLKTLQRHLLGKSPRALPPPKPSDQIQGYKTLRIRTHLETDLKQLGELFLQDLGRSRSISADFIKNCYCATGALSQYSAVSKEILRSRYAALERSVQAKPESVTTRLGINPSLTAITMTEALSNRPIVLVGDVGVGKSMFIRHLLEVEARDLLNNAYVFYIDFGREPALATDLKSYVTRRLVEQLREIHHVDFEESEFVRAVYKKELELLRKSPVGEYADLNPTLYREKEIEYLIGLTGRTEAHLKKTFEHLRKKKRRSPIFVLDNIDQRQPSYQEEVFLIAESLADGWPGTVFVSLRPKTLYESKTKGSLSAYPLKVFTVSPPKIDQVILRRLEWAHEKLLQAAGSGAFATQFSVNAPAMRAVLEALIKAFKENRELNEIIDNLSGGNVRSALEYLNTFIGSPFVSVQRMVEIAERGGVYRVPIHEFMRAIIYGDYNYYVPSESKICNVFDIDTDDGREHFLLLMVLSCVEAEGVAGDSLGYVESSVIRSFGQSAGFSQEQIAPKIAIALSRGLLSAPEGDTFNGPFRITTIGSYMYKSMVQRFSYLDAMVLDTPITDIKYRRLIRDVQSINERLERARIAKNYFDEQWDRLPSGSSDLPFDWTIASAALAADIDKAERRAQDAARRRDEARNEGV
ncbi:AAA family ATPase [Allorhizocola rhizosphaerae]|uniref:AAA family ATPase n=1 Tax=Allorhizocola rhizosphaerae TaxID=1872709 RepID=UPI0013C30C39|nr:AAA family ATPase [Allorhizocola rhizosphaerae]